MSDGRVPPRLTLYSRAGCHLCEIMLEAVRAICADSGVALEVIDVDTDPHLAARHGARVPVLAVDGREVCHFHLDEAALRAALR